MSSKGLPHALHQYVLTDACEPKAFMISVSPPSQNGQDGATGSVSGASSRRRSACAEREG
jgi:hypothetical protein